MPSPLWLKRQRLRTEIARSRRRLDRHARELVGDATRFIPLAQAAGGKAGWAKLLAVAAGVAVSAGALAPIERWWNQLLGNTVSNFIDRVLRRIRVALHRSRRSTNGASTEVSDE